MTISRACALVLAFATCTAAAAQQCPQASTTGPSVESEVRTLEGSLVFHDSIRKWFELKLDRPKCGQTSIELVRRDGDWTLLQVLRACRVKSSGHIGFSPTGYYSLDSYLDVDHIEPVGACARQLPFPDYSNAIPDRSIREYRVDMYLDYEAGDHPITFRVSSARKQLQPWQAYASYMLTGGFVLYGRCGEGFVIDKVFGTPQAKPSHFDGPRTPDDMAMFDPETAAASGKKDLHLGYTCARKP
jgi:hypothetical protein